MNESQWPSAPGSTRSVVVGGGTMGADVAVVLLRASSPTVVVEPDASRHADIREKIEGNLRHIGKAGNIDLLAVAASLDGVDWPGVGLVIECVPESLELKRGLFRELSEKAAPQTVLASNSSSFPISQIAQGLQTRARMIGLHFFMPAHIVPLVEVVQGPDTDAALAESLAAFMRRCGCVPIVVRKDIPGFVGNRLQHALAREAFALIQEGIVSPEDIDAAVRFGFGFRYLAAGPVLQKEHAGLDVHAAAAATIYPTLSNAAEPAAVLADKPKQGKLGMKTGEGFYRWDEASIKAEKQRYERALQGSLAILAKELPPIEP
ncbi:3-hydroxyacyl-CoA dehydrogenase family protein [Parapusillimonas granuli]|uniref:3-hydroxyacyl-CoA dehydrogenase n=1 Tax=Parapusillimonas granuli TaxID=380911 RepID=A0A853G3L1_9BURK|nr:3-hydroxyacyl-CoA dehydrogenase NAD-binding domain-containing protein [Parapusillimonas granuli]MBB5215895.1 3-hydroxybutyryl-CoA dehydrogenase [Parapusillimonas granuli]MEB2399414.1 3-hydroxyacyl-CoA dehydrogenase NAD-binding domain-containing protein [Alcaligenaceae bacterium]NYT50807.1 3-hydroxyacyl-CoA dehydrogenase [Parapusillimonas granuli]